MVGRESLAHVGRRIGRQIDEQPVEIAGGRRHAMTIDGRVLLFTLLATTVTVLLRTDRTGRIEGRSCSTCEVRRYEITPATQAVRKFTGMLAASASSSTTL